MLQSQKIFLMKISKLFVSFVVVISKMVTYFRGKARNRADRPSCTG